uniref:Uncharacterized protein n=1 Tax=Panagrolaimus davidi TaxID=227884 RepID=A0A914PBJ4_9BILA
MSVNFIALIYLLFIRFTSIVLPQRIKKLNGKCEIRGLKHIAPCTRLHSGCHSFYGNVSCANCRIPFPEAKVVLWEEDYVSADDFIIEASIVNGNFQLNGCFSDGTEVENYVQLYLLFNNVCQKGETKRSGVLKEFSAVQYTICDNEYDVKVTFV